MGIKKTGPAIKVALALMENPQGRHWGYELSGQAGVRTGVLYPMLRKMLEEGWLEDGWEEAALAAAESRPARRYYKVTDEGARELGAMAALAPQRRFRITPTPLIELRSL